jgi:hypothetical protein
MLDAMVEPLLGQDTTLLPPPAAVPAAPLAAPAPEPSMTTRPPHARTSSAAISGEPSFTCFTGATLARARKRGHGQICTTHDHIGRRSSPPHEHLIGQAPAPKQSCPAGEQGFALMSATVSTPASLSGHATMPFLPATPAVPAFPAAPPAPPAPPATNAPPELSTSTRPPHEAASKTATGNAPNFTRGF